MVGKFTVSYAYSFLAEGADARILSVFPLIARDQPSSIRRSNTSAELIAKSALNAWHALDIRFAPSGDEDTLAVLN